MKKLLIFALLGAFSNGCGAQELYYPDLSGKTVEKITVYEHRDQNGSVDHKLLHTYTDFDHLATLVSSIKNAKPSHSGPTSIGEYEVDVQFYDNTQKEYLLWLGYTHGESSLVDISEKGDAYTISATDRMSLYFLVGGTEECVQ